ncbi:ATP12 family chaperone protein [Vannielia sp.]|uniref:ATP12 family chaperone protein n=1 Tax=Vannielia sp. TaxID=2813045 RepID=UPI00262E02A1|nr:ATP12 family protein [Vannielia sp.]MDF1871863.1 ATPase [Vannielia sp.]
MAEWAPTRFWKEAGVSEANGGYAVLLDGKPVKTPAKAALVTPSREMAEAVAAEWDAQDGRVNPVTMPVTRSVNSAIDRVAPQFEEVAEIVAAYGETDLICYRAEAPEALVAAQAEAWDPWLTYAAETLSAPMLATTGVMHVAQPANSVAALRSHVAAVDPFTLTALHDLTSLSGSLVMGLAALRGEADPEALWQASRVDELWQIEQWGDDEEAEKVAQRKRGHFLHAARFNRLAAGER